MIERFLGACALAPMAGVTDAAFRLICARHGAGFCVSEMLSAKGWIYSKGQNRNALNLLKRFDGEAPCALQLFGREEKYITEAVKSLEDFGFEWFDLNFGCPAPKIASSGEGSALMKEPVLLGKIVEAAVKATDKDVTAKIRAGWDEENINAVEVAKIIEDSGAKAITVHPRTRTQYYSGRADREIIARVKDSVKIPVFGNGDIDSYASAVDMYEKTKCDSVMIGRGAQGDPWIFEEISAKRRGLDYKKPSIDEKFATVKEHFRLECELYGEKIGILEMRKHIGWYIYGMKEAAKRREVFNKIDSTERLIEALDEFALLQKEYADR